MLPARLLPGSLEKTHQKAKSSMSLNPYPQIHLEKVDSFSIYYGFGDAYCYINPGYPTKIYISFKQRLFCKLY